MIVSLTGTPGVGKSTVAEILRNRGFYVVNITELAVEKNFTLGYDNKRKSHIIDIDELRRYIKKEFSDKAEVIILDGHLSHLVNTRGKVIVLRCSPKELKRRMESKGWNAEKINENLEAEMLDIVLAEAVEMHGEKRVFEIDTTDKSPHKVADIIEQIILNKISISDYRAGNVDWSEDILGSELDGAG
ncbi:MAG TPA: NMP kinase [Thermoplasmatales archaeon]|nr:NMP kinase [Thermoplasmatales archaeon]